MKELFERISLLVPKKIKEAFEREIIYAGIETESKELIGIIIIASLIFSFFSSLTLSYFIAIHIITLFASIFILSMIIIYLIIYNIAESKSAFIKKILPDVLQLISANIESGLTIEKALLQSAKPEFGFLSKELKIASKKIITGKSVEESLSEIKNKIKNKELERALNLIAQAFKSGGSISALLIELSNDLRIESEIESEAKASISIYKLMIMFVSTIAAPLLLAIAVLIVKVISTQIGKFPSIPTTSLVGITQQVSITGAKEFTRQTTQIPFGIIITITLILLVLNVVFSSLILGIINTGSEKQGVKYIPFLLIVSITVFNLTYSIAEKTLFKGI